MRIVDHADIPDFSTLVLSPEELEDLRLLSQKNGREYRRLAETPDTVV